MKAAIAGLYFLLMRVQWSSAQNADVKKEIINHRNSNNSY